MIFFLKFDHWLEKKAKNGSKQNRGRGKNENDNEQEKKSIGEKIRNLQKEIICNVTFSFFLFFEM